MILLLKWVHFSEQICSIHNCTFQITNFGEKKSEKRAQRLVHSSSGKFVSVELEWSKSSTFLFWINGLRQSIPHEISSRLVDQSIHCAAGSAISDTVGLQLRWRRRRLSRFADLAAGERNLVIGLDGLQRVTFSGATLSSSSVVTISCICWANPSTVVEGFVNNADSRRDAWNFSRSILLMRLEATGTAGTIGVTGIWRVAVIQHHLCIIHS